MPHDHECLVHNNNFFSHKSNKSQYCLGTDIGYLDLFYFHRVNKDQLEDSIKAMAVLLNEEKIRFVGLSKASEDTTIKII